MILKSQMVVQNKHTWQLENEEGNEIDPHRKSQIAQQSNLGQVVWQ